MPTSAPRPCRHPRCPAVVPRGVGYCERHKRAQWKKADERRGSREERGYDWTWRTKHRPAQLRREPLCRFCAEHGRVTQATEVDHIDGDSRNNDPANLRSLCRACHSSRTARDQGFAQRKGPR